MILAIVAVATVALFAVAGWRPEWFAAGAIFSAPLHVYRRPFPESIGGLHPPQANLSIFRVCVFLAALGLVVHLVREWRSGNQSISSSMASLAPIVLVAVVAALWISYQSSRSLWSLGGTLAAAQIFYLLAIVVLTAALVLRVLSAGAALATTAASALIPIGFALYQALEPATGPEKYARPVPLASLLDAPVGSDQVRAGGLTSDGLFRPAAFFSDPNFLAIFAVGTVALADPGDWAQRRWQRRALQTLRVLAAAVVFATVSRTGLIVLGAYLVIRYRRLAMARLKAVGLGRSVVVAALVSIATIALVHTSFGVTELTRGASTSSHVGTVRDAVELWWRFPINGAGLGNFGYVFGQPPDRSSAQSFPFTVLAEQGLIGLVIFVIVVFGPAVRLVFISRGMERMPLAIVFLIGAWFYDFPVALDVCAVWLALLLAARDVEALRLPPVYRERAVQVPTS